jgi:hypothetical protein
VCCELDFKEQVAGRAAIRTRVSLARYSELLATPDSERDADRDSSASDGETSLSAGECFGQCDLKYRLEVCAALWPSCTTTSEATKTTGTAASTEHPHEVFDVDTAPRAPSAKVAVLAGLICVESGAKGRFTKFIEELALLRVANALIGSVYGLELLGISSAVGMELSSQFPVLLLDLGFGG